MRRNTNPRLRGGERLRGETRGENRLALSEAARLLKTERGRGSALRIPIIGAKSISFTPTISSHGKRKTHPPLSLDGSNPNEV